MAPSKLSAADKRDIIELYRQPGETTSTIAERYGVSGSTISRVLKSTLPDAEYGALIQQKRLTVDKPQTKADKPPKPKVEVSQLSVDKPIIAAPVQLKDVPLKSPPGSIPQPEAEVSAEKPVIPPA